ncbi:prolipoprotein diacylglyceryltransferase [Terriglobus roseus DSM 18391]|uniref:Prolipoprotein diacylglyceryltransferase n=1 Tax=Terriglobus roseus (strain DSM 18391 / NRRL B-41598 / KBS 63) TaxID=926566 RepID=I3ZG17_TERRK|nr:prolipoprotein diacylglyceryl transferase family protein [Terriglobus roseus]AFL88185.1 prolipoprotein diacylglyceryltransferase [Terriglobus roseus DSM 18391]
MFPYLHIGSLTLGTFGILMWFAAVTAAYVLHRSFLRAGVSADAIVVVSTVMIAGVVGAKLWHELQHPFQLRMAMQEVILPGWSQPLEVLTRFFHWFQAGFAWFGGLLFGIGALMWQGRTHKTGAVRMLDLAAPAAAIGYGVGRIGCLTSGDGDYGVATTLPWGIHIHDDALDPPQPNPPGLLVHPTPIYELLFSLALGWYLWVRGRKGDLPIGQLTGEYLVLSGVGRFLVELLRRNERLYLGMSNAQVASLGTIVVGAIVIAISRSRRSAVVEQTA